MAANHHQRPKCSHIPCLDKCTVLRFKDMNVFRQLKDTEGTKTVTERSVPSGGLQQGPHGRTTPFAGNLLWG